MHTCSSGLGWGSLIVSICLLGGCSSTQLDYNTIDLASTVGDIQTKQILYNLSVVIDNPGAIPAHVDITAGNATTSNSVTPTFGTPLNSALTALAQTTTTVSSAVSTATQNQRSSTRAAGTFGVSASDVWSQSWSYNPVIDGDELRRLRSLYKYGVGQLHNSEFEREYPLVQKPQTVAYGSGNISGTSYPIANDTIYCPDVGLKTKGNVKAFSGSDALTTVPAGCTTITTQIQIPDEHFLHEPGCILCLGRYALYTRFSYPHINPRLEDLHGGWLLTEMDALPSDAIYLGHYGHHDFFIRPEDRRKLSEFTLFVLTPTAQSTAAAAAAGQAATKKPSAGIATFMDQFGNQFQAVQ